MLTVPVWRAKRAAVASCVLSSSVSCRLPRSTVASAGLHGLGNAREVITRGVFSAAVRRPLAGRLWTAPCTSSCVRRRARFDFEGVDTSPTPGAPVPRFSTRSAKRPFALILRTCAAHARPGRPPRRARASDARKGVLCQHPRSMAMVVVLSR